jgi:hypothetical protein
MRFSVRSSGCVLFIFRRKNMRKQGVLFILLAAVICLLVACLATCGDTDNIPTEPLTEPPTGPMTEPPTEFPTEKLEGLRAGMSVIFDYKKLK